LSVRLKLTLSYAGFLVLAGALLLALWVLLLRYFPHAPIIRATRPGIGGALLPGRSPDQQAFGEAAAIALAFLLVGRAPWKQRTADARSRGSDERSVGEVDRKSVV